jgi:SAM-dependent methyltransferase
MVSRKIYWISSIKPENFGLIKELEENLSLFYGSNPDYYNDINFTSSNWVNPKEKGYIEIAAFAKQSHRVCEIGCGSANILKHYNQLEANYFGCDFSQTLLEKNKTLYPRATFVSLDKPNILPFEDDSFDLVFSVFVIEHSANPSQFLNECSRILKPDGRLIILCPDFLGKLRMTSQRSGYSQGTTSQKIKSGKIIDAIVTIFDNRIRIPAYCWRLRRNAAKQPLFFVNVQPVVFDDKFLPDVDAVYVTYKPEIEAYLRKSFLLNENTSELKQYENEKRVIFLSLQKL